MQRMGYYDTMKSYGAFEGIRYTFTIQPELHTAARARTYMQRVARFDAEVIHRVALRMSQPLNAPLISAIEAETPLRSLSWCGITSASGGTTAPAAIWTKPAIAATA